MTAAGGGAQQEVQTMPGIKRITNMRKYGARLVAAVCMAFAGARPLHAETIDLFVLAGQSNMQGWQGDASGYPADPDGLDQKVRFYWVTPKHSSSGGKWTHLQPQGGRFPAGHFGPEITFTRNLRFAGYNPAVFKYSLGYTSLAADWKAPGGNGMYDGMVAELKKAVAQLVKEGHTVRFRALVWIQGESDAETKELSAAYGKRLESLISDFRTNVAKDPEMLFILGLDEQHPWVKANPEVVAQQQRIAARDPHVIFTSMAGLEKADVSHLTPLGLQEHGKRLYIAFLALTRQNQQRAAADADKTRR
jgi:hypothetical protein